MMIKSPESNDKTIGSLLEEAHLGKIQLPEFQRDWTWDDDRIRGIIASVSQGHPMGVIMRLGYGNEEIKFKYRVLTGIKDMNVVPEYLILDGQQRLTSLYQSLYSENPVVTTTEKNKNKKIKRYYYLDMKKCIDQKEDREDAILSIPEDKKMKENFDRDIVLDLSTREKEVEHMMFPVNLVFNSTEERRWGREYGKYYSNNDEAMDIYDKFAESVIDTIIAYTLPVITLPKETPRDAVCKVFENVNTGGVSLTVFELVTASYAIYEFDLRKDWTECRKYIRGENEEIKNTDVFDEIDETTYLTTITLYTSYLNKINGKSGMVSCKKKDVLSLPYEDYKKNRDIVLIGYKIAREFLLKYQYVFRNRDLPYSTQVIPLAAICACLREKKCNEPNTTKLISRWYWCGILGEMYGGSNETRYANDIEDVIAEINGEESKNRTVNAAFFSSTRLLTLQTRQSAAYKGIMTLLYKEKCRDFMNDITIDLVNSMIQSPDIHHIFPKKYCEEQKYRKEKWNSIVNKTPLLPETNRAIGGHAPSKYIQNILKKVDGLTEQELEARVESHLINYEYLNTDEFNKYFIDRAKKIIDIIEKAMGKKVPDRDSEITIEQFGASLED